ncbi:MAG TPA: hypothetical protein VNY51_03940, partial [Candidatus Dormibacteraeota bacterium]|nr:hypothetical protein [Candidatus Dormibacteraeota bacterium]
MTIPQKDGRDHAFEAIKDKLIKQSNLYEFNRLAIIWATAFGVYVFWRLVTSFMDDSGWTSPIRALLTTALSAGLLQALLLPDRVVLWLRPFGFDSHFNIAFPIHTSVVPFGRIVALARQHDHADELWALLPKKSDAAELADRIIYKIHNKNTRIKPGSLLKCPDAQWKDVIQKWMAAAGLVIIDASNIGPGLRWEIKLLCEHFGPDGVIFCLVEAVDSLTDPTLDELMGLLGDWHPGRRRIVRYPRTATDTTEVTGKMVTQIAECLALQEMVRGRAVG